jgi:ABC-type multidrug transport system fused ATPase/permease subunit
VMTFGERVVADVRRAVFDHLTKLDAAFYDRSRSGELVSRLSADTTQLKSAFGASASIALRNLVLFLGATAMMVWTSPKLSGLVLIAIPLIVLPLIGAGRSVRRRSREAQDALAETSAYATEQIGASRTMQIFGAEPRVRSAYGKAVELAYGTARDSLRARALLTAIAIFFIFASVIGILWLGAQAVIAGQMTAVHPLCRLCRKLAQPAFGGLDRGFRGSRSRRADRRTAGDQAAGIGARGAVGTAACHRRYPAGECHFRLPVAAGACRRRPARHPCEAGRAHRRCRPVRGWQVDSHPAHRAVL